ncbi:MAG: M23 family metallopeptidase [Nitrospirota bacterium]|jgi:murein DD-endopeptidase MepM/ murein hydrolase activator NlpD
MNILRNKSVIAAFIFFFFTFSLSPLAFSLNSSIKTSFKPEKIKQGDILYLTVKANPGVYRTEGTFLNKPIPFYENSNKEKAALIGIDMNTEPGVYTLSITFENEKGKKIKKNYKVKVRPAKFGIQRLTLPKEMVELDEETLKRVRAEQEKIGKVWDIFTEEYLWEGNFIAPAEGELSSNFGLRRIINGEPRNPHNGIDFAAPEGAPVYAPNHGRVVFIDEQFFSGKSLIIDHGRELFSMYFHLSEIVVKDGEEIKKGRLIAKVGKSGRATGPHLHWGMRLNGARVNPISIVNLPLE